MKKYLLGLIFLILLAMIPNPAFSQIVVKVNKTDQEVLNRLEKLNVNLCFEQSDYLVISPKNTKILSDANIKYQILTSDNQENPLYFVTGKKGVKFQTEAYLDEIILDGQVRLEKINKPIRALMPKDGVRFTPLRISPKLYQNKRQVTYSAKSFQRDFSEVVASVNADSVAWFIQKLEDFDTRFALLDNRKEIAQWIAGQFTRFGYNNVAIDSFYVEPYNTWQYNVVCVEEGILTPDQFVIVGGHHDSIITPNINEAYTFAPGADDNASGVSAVLETARVMKLHNIQPNSSVRFITFAMEEFGLFGSHYDAVNLANAETNVIAMLNSDMISNSSNDDFIFTLLTYPGAEALTDYTYNLSSELGMQTYQFNTASQGSDSWAYHTNGFPAIFFSEADFSPFYHSSEDISENTNSSYAAQFIKLVASSTLNIANLPPTPQEFNVTDTGDGNSVYASWEDLNMDNVAYELNVKDVSTGLVSIFSTNDSSYTITDLEINNDYEISLYSILDNVRSFGVIRFISPQDIPSQVQDFTYEANLQQINLAWTQNSELDIASYNIYRKEVTETEYSLLENVNAQVNSYEDSSTISRVWYNYLIKAKDSDDNESPASEILTARHLSFDSGIGIVDFTTYSESNLLFPSQENIENFYNLVFANYEYDIIHQEQNSELKIDDIGIYSSVFIFKNSFSTITNQDLLTILENYMSFGGNVFISAADPIKFLKLNNDIYPANFSPGQVAYDLLGISQVDSNSSARFARAQAISWDITDLEVEPDNIYPSFNNLLFGLEALSPASSDTVEELYSYQSDQESAPQNYFDDYLVAIKKQTPSSQVVTTTLPLYFIKVEQAKAFVERTLDSFGESVDIDTHEINPSMSNLWLRNYPNPFNPETSINFSLESTSDISLKIYNVKGQLVRTFTKNNLNIGNHTINWNGKNDQGNALSSGVYFYKLSTNKGNSCVKKMLLMK